MSNSTSSSACPPVDLLPVPQCAYYAPFPRFVFLVLACCLSSPALVVTAVATLRFVRWRTGGGIAHLRVLNGFLCAATIFSVTCYKAVTGTVSGSDPLATSLDVLAYSTIYAQNLFAALEKWRGIQNVSRSALQVDAGLSTVFVRIETAFRVNSILGLIFTVATLVAIQALVRSTATSPTDVPWRALCQLHWFGALLEIGLTGLLAAWAASSILKQFRVSWPLMTPEQQASCKSIVDYLAASRQRHLLGTIISLPSSLILTTGVLPCEFSQYVLAFLYAITPLSQLHYTIRFYKQETKKRRAVVTMAGPAAGGGAAAGAPSILALLSLGDQVTYVRRNKFGDMVESAVVGGEGEDGVATAENLNGGVIIGDVDDGTKDLSILSQKQLLVLEEDTVLGGGGPFQEHVLEACWNPRAHVAMVGFASAWAVASQVLMALILTGTIPGWVSVPVGVVNVLGIAVYLCCLVSSEIVVKKLGVTSFLRFRVAALVTLWVLMSLVLGDERCVLVPGFILTLFAAFCGDAVVRRGRTARVGLVVFVALSLVIWLVCITFELVATANNNVWVVSAEFSFASQQSCRDMLLVTLVLLMEELRFLLRRTDGQRFFHLGGQVTREIVTFEESEWQATHGERNKGDGGGGGSAAASMFAQSGFLMRKQRSEVSSVVAAVPTAARRRKKRVYVDHVCISQYDAYAFHWFGKERGRAVYEWVDGLLKVLVTLVDRVLILACFVGMGMGVPYAVELGLCLGLLGSTSVWLAFDFLQRSRRLTLLLVRRPAFWVQLGGIVVWVVGASWTLQDVRVVVALSVAAHFLNDVLVDAHTKPFHRTRNVGNVVLNAMEFAAVSSMLVWGRLRGVHHPFFVLGTSWSSLDDANVVDVVQTTAEFGFTLGVTLLAKALWLARNFDSHTFADVKTPTVPGWVGG